MDLINPNVPSTEFSLDAILKSCGLNLGNLYSESTKKAKLNGYYKQPQLANNKITSIPNDSDNSTVLLEAISKSLDEMNLLA